MAVMIGGAVDTERNDNRRKHDTNSCFLQPAHQHLQHHNTDRNIEILAKFLIYY